MHPISMNTIALKKSHIRNQLSNNHLPHSVRLVLSYPHKIHTILLASPSRDGLFFTPLFPSNHSLPMICHALPCPILLCPFFAHTLPCSVHIKLHPPTTTPLASHITFGTPAPLFEHPALPLNTPTKKDLTSHRLPSLNSPPTENQSHMQDVISCYLVNLICKLSFILYSSFSL